MHMAHAVCISCKEFMESVMQIIREARDDNRKRQADNCTPDTIVAGCQVKMHFDENGGGKVMTDICSMLISSHLNVALIAPHGGE